MAFRFHAVPPSGQWMNDPNALVYEGGRYRLYAQHSPQPGFGPMGWGCQSSTDLLSWRWDGVALAPTSTHSVYSGSVVRAPDGRLDVFATLHERATGYETQHRIAFDRPVLPTGAIGPAGLNCRDPFVFFWGPTNDWRMLVAHPCDTVAWPGTASSDLTVWASRDRLTWSDAGRIGPWDRPGVMWEVPVLIDFGATQALIVSLVDLTGGARRCTVRYWLGAFTGDGFTVDRDFPDAGILLDHGPDFYAAIPNLADG